MSRLPDKLHAARVPLFDRLADSAPGQSTELSPLRVYTRPGLHASIAREMSRLLNTRRTTAPVLNPNTATVLDYGVPSFSHLSAGSATDRRLFAETIRAAIAFFEPRARDVVVQVEPDPEQPAAMLAYISCRVRLGSTIEPVTFPLVVRNREGTVEILEPVSNADATIAATERERKLGKLDG